MKKSIRFWQFAGFVFTSVLGVLLHFLFDWTGGSVSVAPFSAVNESIWEHLKLLFFPMFVFAFIENQYIGKGYKNFWCIKLIGIVFGVLLTLILYYVINGAFGKTPDWVNIVIFFVSTLSGYLLETQLFGKNSIKCESPKTALGILWLIALTFVIFTFVPPRIPLFFDPTTGGYGF
ncbi:MAG: hypothetical protein J6D15_05385 [Clostridia bacterium]|nr:hypothetical protein [Clostridia bacterium]